MKKSSLNVAASLPLIVGLGLAGCSGSNNESSAAPKDSLGPTNAAPAQQAKTPSGKYSSNTKTGEKINAETHHTRDSLTWDTGSEIRLDLANEPSADGVSVEDGALVITKAGNYHLSGDYTGQVRINTAEPETVRLILDNVSITNSTGPAITASGGGTTIVYTMAGTTNTVSDGEQYTVTGKKKPDAAIYSTANLTLAGEGTLTVNGNHEEGVHSTSGLVISNGTLNVNSVKTGIKGKNYVDILGGEVSVNSQKDAIKATNSKEEGYGWARITGGTVKVIAGDDGLKAIRTVEIADGTLNIEKAREGVEGQYINIFGGAVSVNSIDDGINASLKDPLPDGQEAEEATDPTPDGQPQQEPSGSVGGARDTTEVIDAAINISGGQVTVNVEGDGIDSNGSQTYTGGTVIVNGPPTYLNNSVDANGELLLNGVNIAAAGSGAEMFKVPSEKSTNGYLRVVDLDVFTPGRTVQVTDTETGAVVANYTVVTSGVQLFFLSNPSLVKGNNYTVYTVSEPVQEGSTTLAPGAVEVGTYAAE